MTSARKRPRIVLADDHAPVLAAFGRMLRASCDVVASVSDGRSAVEAATRLRPDVLVVDLNMPDLDGLEACRRVRLAAPETQVLIVTAYDDAQVRELVLKSGAAAFVSKQTAATTLEETIHEICEAERGPTPAE